MRILLANKFYYQRGGDCICTMNLEQLLKKHGHEVAIFSMSYSKNKDTKWSSYFPSEVKFKFGIGMIEAFMRPFGSSEVKKKFAKLLDDFRPDVVHLHNIHTQLSPIIAEMAHDRGIKVVWTLHDTKLVCPCYTCMRNGKWCTECLTNPKAVVRHKCMPGGKIGALIGWRERLKWNAERLQRCTDLFLPPSQFMKDTVVRGGYNAEKFKVLCNFIDLEKIKNPSFRKEGYYVYLGRVNAVKGVHTLCKAAAQLPFKLKVIGDGDLLEELKTQYSETRNIEFLGLKNWDEFRPILERAKFMVLPSEWSENNPLTVIEAQSLGTPVLGSWIGGIPELIEDGVNGMTFIGGNVEDLKVKIQEMWNSEFNYKAIAEQAFARYSSETYYEKIIEIYNQ